MVVIPRPARQRSLSKLCERRVDDVTNTIFAGPHHLFQTWTLCLYCMGLTLSNAHMAKERALHKNDVHQRTSR